MNLKKDTTRIAAVADLHVQKNDKGKWKDLFIQISGHADILLLCGDLTNTGAIDEAEVLKGELMYCDIPVLAVLGNHDYEGGQVEQLFDLLRNDHVHLLNGENYVFRQIGFAGVKGFCGGFDTGRLRAFGEPAIKAFVNETQREAALLDHALAQLEEQYGDIPKIALLHYAPVIDTVRGEPETIFPFLGSSRLAEPLSKRNVIAAFHGHAHAGTLRGEALNVEIFNVSFEVIRNATLGYPFFLYEI